MSKIHRGAEILQRARGQKILDLGIDEGLWFKLEGGLNFQILDNGQDCCEERYMSTDDALAYFVGASFLDAWIADADYGIDPESYNQVDVQFLIVRTSLGEFTVANYNIHNGFYGGWRMEVWLTR